MKLHGLLGNHQAQANLCVGQTLDTTQRHLGLAAAQVSIFCNSLDHAFKRTVAGCGSFSVSDKTVFIAARDYFFRRKHPISNALVARASCMRAALALNTELADQAFQAAPDRAQTLNS